MDTDTDTNTDFHMDIKVGHSHCPCLCPCPCFTSCHILFCIYSMIMPSVFNGELWEMEIDTNKDIDMDTDMGT
jgi:hypothetical protein